MRNIVESKTYPMESEENKVLLDHAQNKVIRTYNYVMDRFEEKYSVRFDGSLKFSRHEERYLATAVLYRDYIQVCLPHVVNCEIYRTLIHELAHFITHDKQLTGEFINMPHCFLFGVLCCLLRRDLLGEKENFFKPYDFHEDAMYKHLIFNPFEFDQKIMAAWYDSFDEMIDTAQAIAKEMHREIEERIGYQPIKKCHVAEDFEEFMEE